MKAASIVLVVLCVIGGIVYFKASEQQQSTLFRDHGTTRLESSKVPDSLQHLVPYVERWSAVGRGSGLLPYWMYPESEGPSPLQNRLSSDPDFATKMADAREFARLLTPELQEEFSWWADREPITESEETSAFYFAILAIGELNLLQEDENWNTVESHLHSLTQFGSYRLASGRKFAAMFLADFGEEGRSAIDALRVATDDEDVRVRVWAHFALYRLDGGDKSHVESLRDYLQQDGMDAKTEAAEALGKIGADARSAVPVLVNLIRADNPDEEGVPFFLEALRLIDPDNPQTIDVIRHAAQSENSWIRNAAREKLEAMEAADQ